jgi:hypothetical protein
MELIGHDRRYYLPDIIKTIRRLHIKGTSNEEAEEIR